MSDTNHSAPFETWGIVEVMGHNRFAGFIQEQKLGGATLLRIDVPASDGRQTFSKLLGMHSIFAITPTTEATARAVACAQSSQPFSEWDLVRLPPPPMTDRETDDDIEPADCAGMSG